jgi:plastocyanin
MKIRASASGVSGAPEFTAIIADATSDVQVINNQFDPLVAAVTAGGTVTFTWPVGAQDHNLVPDGGATLPNEPTVHDGPFSLPVTFPTAGTFAYHCSVHGSAGAGMHGSIVVVP